MDRKRLFAVAAAGILLLAGAGLIIEKASSPMAMPAAPRGKSYPIPPDNVALGTGPELEAETTIAISPADHDTMVAGAIDYNIPARPLPYQYHWDAYHTTHDRGATWKRGLLGGFPGGPVNALTGYRCACDPVIAVDSAGNFYYSGVAMSRPYSDWGILGRANCVFVAKSTDQGDKFAQTVVVWSASASVVRFNDKDWLAVDPVNGNVYFIWLIYSASTTYDYFSTFARLMFSRSTDGGKSWSQPLTITETLSGEIKLTDGSMVVDGSGVIHVSWVDYPTKSIRYAQSKDNGQSFSKPVNVAAMTPIAYQLPNSNYRAGSLDTIAVDLSGSKTKGSLYITWPDYGSGDSDILLIASHDGGNSWSDPVRVNNDTEANGADQFFPTVAVSAEGWVHVGFYDRRSDPYNTLLEYWWAISFDGGQSFPINIPMSNVSFNGDYSGGFIGDYTSITANNETVAAIWCDTRNGSETAPQADVYGAVVPYKELLRTNKFANVTIPWPEQNQ